MYAAMSFDQGIGDPLQMFARVPGEEITARAGKPLPKGVSVAGEDALIAALKTVHDPEIPVNIPSFLAKSLEVSIEASSLTGTY